MIIAGLSDLLLDLHNMASEKRKINPKKTEKASDVLDSLGYTLTDNAARINKGVGLNGKHMLGLSVAPLQ